jgi:hypothetical protein
MLLILQLPTAHTNNSEYGCQREESAMDRMMAATKDVLRKSRGMRQVLPGYTYNSMNNSLLHIKLYVVCVTHACEIALGSMSTVTCVYAACTSKSSLCIHDVTIAPLTVTHCY